MASRHPRRRPPRRGSPSRQGEAAERFAEVALAFEDDDWIVAVKPAGLATANVPAGEPSLLTVLRDGGHCGRDGFLGVVSRLDKPVSGLVAVAKTRSAAADLARQFRERTVRKTYLALTEGRFPAAVGHTLRWIDAIERPTEHPGPHGKDGSEMTAAREAAVEATLLARGSEVSLVDLRPATGRRHQLRAQLAARGCPIIGDGLYGARLPFPAGIGLHAAGLALEHPATAVAVSFKAALPRAWGGFLERLPPPPPGSLPLSPDPRGDVPSRGPAAGETGA